MHMHLGSVPERFPDKPWDQWDRGAFWEIWESGETRGGVRERVFGQRSPSSVGQPLISALVDSVALVATYKERMNNTNWLYMEHRLAYTMVYIQSFCKSMRCDKHIRIVQHKLYIQNGLFTKKINTPESKHLQET